MNRKELHQQILTLLEQGKPRDEIAAEMKQVGLQDDPYADFDVIVSQYADVALSKKLRGLRYAFVFACALLGAWLLISYLLSLYQFIQTKQGGGFWLFMQPLLGIAILTSPFAGLRLQHQGYLVPAALLLLVGDRGGAFGVSALIVMGVGLYLRSRLFPHLPIMGKIKTLVAR